MELLQLQCPTCKSAVLQSHTTYATQHHGRRIIYKCASCLDYFSETKTTLMEGLKTPVSVIWQVLKARTEGMGFNAAARTFEKAKNTILAWEGKFRIWSRITSRIAAAVVPFQCSKFWLKECGMDGYTAEVEQKMQRFFGWLSEKDRRRYAAVEAAKLGHGGIEYIARVLACDPKTIRQGLRELEETEDAVTGHIRKKGGAVRRAPSHSRS